MVANNLANAETTACKSSRANFEDLIYQELKQPGTTDSAETVSPAGIFVGLGTKLSNTQLDLSQGSMENTGSPLDIAISGNGFIPVKILTALGGTGYTRAGSLTVNNLGNLVVNIGDGYKLDPPLTLPTNATNISIGTDGTVTYVKAGNPTKVIAGQIKLAMFPQSEGLNLLGGSIYTATDASGKAVGEPPGTKRDRSRSSAGIWNRAMSIR